MPFPASRLSQTAPPAGLHPLDAQDRATIASLLEVTAPVPLDIVNAARLNTRYRDSELSKDLYPMLIQAVANWGMTIDEVVKRALGVWSSGWRPEAARSDEITVGSGANVEE